MSNKVYVQINSIDVQKGVSESIAKEYSGTADPYIYFQRTGAQFKQYGSDDIKRNHRKSVLQTGGYEWKTSRIVDIVEDPNVIPSDEYFTKFSGTGEFFTVNFHVPTTRFQFAVYDSDWGSDDYMGKSSNFMMSDYIRWSSQPAYTKSASTLADWTFYNGKWQKPAFGKVRASFCMDTLNWTSTNGQTCDQLTGSKCDIKTESAMPGVDLSSIGNDAASNCCSCGKRKAGWQTVGTAASPNGAFCSNAGCMPSSTGTLLPALSAEELNLMALHGGELSSEMVEIPEVTSQSEFCIIAIMAVLAMATLIEFFRRKASAKFSSDDFLRAELIETENKDTSAAKINA